MQHNTFERSDTSTLQEYVTSILPDSFRPNFGEDLDLHKPLDFGQEPPCLWPDEEDGDFNLRSRDAANYNLDDRLWSATDGDLNLGLQAEANHNLNADLWSTSDGNSNLGSRAEANYNQDDLLWSVPMGDLGLGSRAEANYNLNGDLWSPANSYFNLKGDTDSWAEIARAEPICSRKPEKNFHSVGENMSTATNYERYNQVSLITNLYFILLTMR